MEAAKKSEFRGCLINKYYNIRLFLFASLSSLVRS